MRCLQGDWALGGPLRLTEAGLVPSPNPCASLVFFRLVEHCNFDGNKGISLQF